MLTEEAIRDKLNLARLRGVKHITSFEYKLRHPERVTEQKRRYYVKHYEQIVAYRLKNKEKQRSYDAQRKRTAANRHADNIRRYGITQEEFEEIRTRQNNRCAICEDDFTKTPRVDHDHTTGEVRGLLCGPCNIGIGLLKDSVSRLQKAIQYLELRGVVIQ